MASVKAYAKTYEYVKSFVKSYVKAQLKAFLKAQCKALSSVPGTSYMSLADQRYSNFCIVVPLISQTCVSLTITLYLSLPLSSSVSLPLSLSWGILTCQRGLISLGKKVGRFAPEQLMSIHCLKGNPFSEI